MEKDTKELPDLSFVRVGKGRLALYHRPKHTDFAVLRQMGCTHVITLLKESEGAQRYGALVENAGMEWIWLPVPNGGYPEGDVHQRILEAMPKLTQLLEDGRSILIHCSAGIHRTGMIAYALLRWRGMSREEAMNVIGKTRRETAEGMLEKRMRWGDENARPAAAQENKWLHFVKEFARRLKMKLSNSR